MEHKTLAAAVTDTDTEQGTFEAIVSAWDADREGDVIDRHAFDATIAAWIGSGKMIPLLFEHSTTVVGSVDPASVHPTAAGLVVAGEVDRSTDEGQQVWRTIKSGTAGFSIGYMAKGRARKGGGRELTEIDLLEISATAKPMHPATRALSWKSAEPAPDSEARALMEILSRPRDARAPATKSTAPLTIARYEC